MDRISLSYCPKPIAYAAASIGIFFLIGCTPRTAELEDFQSGLDAGLDWAKVDLKVGDVRILSIPIVQGGGGDFDSGIGKGSSFLFETAGLCIAHLGDLAEPMNPSQLRRLGKIHVAMVVLSDRVSMGPAEAAEFIHRLSPNIAIPMHYYDDPETLAAFLARFRRVRRMDSSRLMVSRRALPPPTEIVLLRRRD